MTNSFQLIPTERPPFLDSMAEMVSQELVQGVRRDTPTSPLLLRDARRFLGNLWLPSYLPDGFDMNWAEVTNPAREHPDLIFPQATPAENEGDDGCIVLTADRSELYTHEYVPIEPETSVTSVAIGGREGFMIRGGWLNVLSEDGAVHFSGWDDKHTLKLVLKDQMQDQIITLEARPASSVSEDELIRVAESLELSRVYRSWLPWLRRG